MQTKNLNSLAIPVRTQKANSLAQNEYLNLPDLQFFNWCNRQYGVNKGVFNTIDNWFFEYGITNILSRRIYILAFLDFSVNAGLKQEEHKFIRFGNGGLNQKLNEFINIENKLIKNSVFSRRMRV